MSRRAGPRRRPGERALRPAARCPPSPPRSDPAGRRRRPSALAASMNRSSIAIRLPRPMDSSIVTVSSPPGAWRWAYGAPVQISRPSTAPRARRGRRSPRARPRPSSRAHETGTSTSGPSGPNRDPRRRSGGRPTTRQGEVVGHQRRVDEAGGGDEVERRGAQRPRRAPALRPGAGDPFDRALRSTSSRLPARRAWRRPRGTSRQASSWPPAGSPPSSPGTSRACGWARTRLMGCPAGESARIRGAPTLTPNSACDILTGGRRGGRRRDRVVVEGEGDRQARRLARRSTDRGGSTGGVTASS